MSSPQLPSASLQGASCTQGGIFRDQAAGNVYNHGDDFDTQTENQVLEIPKCKVHIYKQDDSRSLDFNPLNTQSNFTVKVS